LACNLIAQTVMDNQVEIAMNTITVAQETPLNIKRLKAQRQLYSVAKSLGALQIFLNVPVIIVISIVAMIFDKAWYVPKHDLAWLVGASGMTFFLLDTLVWGPMINRRRTCAAKIQQLFDGEVLQLEWDDVLYGKKPDHDVVERYAKKFDARSPNADSRPWYRVEIANAPLELARLLCQRTNLAWDMSLRERYNAWIWVAGGLFVGIILVIAVGFDLTAKNFFALVVAPCLPFIAVAAKTIQDNKDAIDRLAQMKDSIENQWEQMLQVGQLPTNIAEFSGQIQRGIFLNRQNNPLIFDWIHYRLRDDNESVAGASAQHYLDECTRHGVI
jgi:SMODS-associating 4TM effector domain